MDPRNYLSLIIRRWKGILAVGLIFVVISGSWTLLFAKTRYNSTLFFTVAGEKGSISLYEDTRGADLFSETVQGWTKNPGLIEEIGKQTNINFDISGRVQESQNVVVDLSADSKEAIVKVSETTLKVLQDKVTEFNNETGNSFVLAIPTIKYVISEPTLGKNEIIFFVIGLLIGILLAFVYEYLADKASFEHQIEEILEEKIAGRGVEMLEILKENLKEFGILNLVSGEQNWAMKQENLIVLVKLGHTKLGDIKKAKIYSTSRIYPIVIK